MTCILGSIQTLVSLLQIHPNWHSFNAVVGSLGPIKVIWLQAVRHFADVDHPQAPPPAAPSSRQMKHLDSVTMLWDRIEPGWNNHCTKHFFGEKLVVCGPPHLREEILMTVPFQSPFLSITLIFHIRYRLAATALLGKANWQSGSFHSSSANCFSVSQWKCCWGMQDNLLPPLVCKMVLM